MTALRFAVPALAAWMLMPLASFAGNDDRCPPPPDPIVNLSFVSRYADDDVTRAQLDPERAAEVDEALAPLDLFITDLADRTEALYTGTVRDRRQAADCILSQLAAWASADALADQGTDTVRLTIGSRLAAFSLILWQTAAYAPDDPDRTVVLAWLDRRVDEQIAFWQRTSGGASTGNLRAWSGLAAAAQSQQTGNADIRDWAASSIRAVICTARPDGGLPQELSRGRRALHYQLHAIAPLVTATVLLERQGISIAGDCDDALHRIVSFAVTDLVSGAKTQEITGAEQTLFNGEDALSAFQLAWIEPYLLLHSNNTLQALARDLRPLIYSKLGGNQTELWHN